MIKKINPKHLHYSLEFQKLCKKEYPGHCGDKAGCPKYNSPKTRGECPPGLPLIDKVLDLKKPLYIIWTDFEIGKHARRMWKKHPKWTSKQAYCLLYWQPKARKIHTQEIENYKQEYGFDKIVTVPEAYGVSIIGLLARFGVNLEWFRKKSDGLYNLPEITRRVSLAGYSV